MAPKHNVEAEEKYRAAWTQYCLSSNQRTKLAMESLMDEIQPQIARGPMDPRWKEFIDTLPGFQEFWNNWLRDVETWVEDHFGNSNITRRL